MAENEDGSGRRGARRGLALAFKNTALGLAAATFALVAIGAGDGATYAVILAVGLAALALGADIEA